MIQASTGSVIRAASRRSGVVGLSHNFVGRPDVFDKAPFITGSAVVVDQGVLAVRRNAVNAAGVSVEKLENAIKEYERVGLKAHSRLFDVTNDMEVKTSINAIEKEIGAIDILINNAGIIKRTPMVDMEASDFRHVIDVDLIAPFIVSKYVGKHMIARKAGKVINICSMMSELGRDTVSAYAASNGGLKMLTRNMATK